MLIPRVLKVLGLVGATAFALVSLPGCSLLEGPKVKSPLTDQSVSIEQAQLDLLALEKQKEAEAAQERKDREAELRKAQRDAERALSRLANDSAEKVAEITDAADDAASAIDQRYTNQDNARQQALAAIRSSFNARIASAQAQQNAIQNGFQFVGQVAQSSGIPGVSTAGGLLLGLGGLLWGAKKSGDAKEARAVARAKDDESAAHDDAWEEQEKLKNAAVAQAQAQAQAAQFAQLIASLIPKHTTNPAASAGPASPASP